MELGIDGKQIAAFKEKFRRAGTDRVQFRLLLTVLISAVGYFGLLRPAIKSMESTAALRDEARAKARAADELRTCGEIRACYEPRLGHSEDTVDWGNYIVSQLSKTACQLVSLEPHKTGNKGPFRVVEFEVEVRGFYPDLADFVDRLERGERIVRIDRLRLEKMQETTALVLLVKCLVKPSAAHVPEKAGKPATTDHAPEDADGGKPESEKSEVGP